MLIFDLDNTLLNRTKMMREYLIASGHEEHLNPILKADRAGYPPREPFFELLARVSNQSQDALTSAFYKDFGQIARIDPDIHNLLRTLQRSHDLALLTNGTIANQSAKIEGAGLAQFFEGKIFISEAIGAEKPAAEAFMHVLTSLEVRPEECVYIGDHPKHDIMGAKACGIPTCWVSMGRTWPLDMAPDWSVEAVEHLLDLPEFEP